MAGALVALEGIDQAGKMTQARAVQAAMTAMGLACAIRQYPDYSTPLGRLLESALTGRVALEPRARTMLFAANRWEKDAEIRALLQTHDVVLVDRYSNSNVVYGLAQGYDEAWLRALEAGLCPADLTILLDIPEQESLRRKQRERDDFERDVTLLARARELYRRLAEDPTWQTIDATPAADTVRREVLRCLRVRLGGRFPLLARLEA